MTTWKTGGPPAAAYAKAQIPMIMGSGCVPAEQTRRRTGASGTLEPFRQQLIKGIAAESDRSYWESWTTALEALVPTLPERSTP